MQALGYTSDISKRFEFVDTTCPECGVEYVNYRGEILCPHCGTVYGYTYYSGRAPLNSLVAGKLSKNSSKKFLKEVKKIIDKTLKEFREIVNTTGVRYCEDLLNDAILALYEILSREKYYSCPKFSLPYLLALAILETVNPSAMVKLYIYRVVRPSRTAKKTLAAVKKELEQRMNVTPLVKALSLISIVTGVGLSKLLEDPPKAILESATPRKYYSVAKKYLLKKGYTKEQLHRALTPIPLRSLLSDTSQSHTFRGL